MCVCVCVCVCVVAGGGGGFRFELVGWLGEFDVFVCVGFIYSFIHLRRRWWGG